MLNLKNQPDELLFALVQKNDIRATAELLDRYKNKVYTAIYLLIKDKYVSEDIFQETCLKVINCIRNNNYEDDGRFLPWIMRIARNMAIDYIRNSKRNPKIMMSDGKDIFAMLNMNEKSIEDKTMLTQSSGRVRKMLDLIPYEQREVVVMRLFGNLSFKEIAQMTDVSVNTALGRMRYALLSLRKIADEKGILL